MVRLRNRTTTDRTPLPTVLVRGPLVEVTTGDPDQPFFIASIDKVFIATLIAQLVDEGRIDPSSSIADLLPRQEIALLPARPTDSGPPTSSITVQQLLSHTSGLPDVMFPPRGHQSACSIRAIEANPERAWTTPEMLAEAENLPSLAAPGSVFHYGDTAYLLLIRIAEEARDAAYGDMLRSRIFERSGMADTASWVGATGDTLDSLHTRLAPFTLSARGDGRAHLHNLVWTNGLGGISTANDLVRFQEHLHAGLLCSADAVQMMAADPRRLRPGIHYGSGLAILRFGGFSPFFRGYPQPVGGLGYTATHMFYYPQQKTHVVLNFGSHRAMARSFREHIRLAGLIRKESRSASVGSAR